MNSNEFEIAIRNYDIERLERLLLEELLLKPSSGELLIKLALTVLMVPLVDYESALSYVVRAMENSQVRWKALILKAYIEKFHLGGVETTTYEALINCPDMPEENHSLVSIVNYWLHEYDDDIQRIQVLKSCIEEAPDNVYPYMCLSRIFKNRGELKLSGEYKTAGLSKVVRIFEPEECYDFTELTNFLNENILQRFMSKEVYNFYENL